MSITVHNTAEKLETANTETSNTGVPSVTVCCSPGIDSVEEPDAVSGSSASNGSPTPTSSSSTGSMPSSPPPRFTRTAQMRLPLLVQKEMSKLFAARCDANQFDLAPFKVVMNLIRDHYQATNKPEIVRVLIRLLCQYQPLQGEKEYRKLLSLCEDLLSSIDEEVRETFLAMIPGPSRARQSDFQPLGTMVCGHVIRDTTTKDDKINPLTEMIRRPLLSYQTMPAPLFQQPFSKLPLNLLNTSETHKDSDNSKSAFQMINQFPNPVSLGHSCSGPLPIPSNLPLSNNSLMWFTRTGPSSLHSPITRPVTSQFGNPLNQPFLSSGMTSHGSSSSFNPTDLKKQQLLHRKQEIMKNIDNLTKYKSFDNTSTSASTNTTGNSEGSSPSKFPLAWLSVPHCCKLRPNNNNSNSNNNVIYNDTNKYTRKLPKDFLLRNETEQTDNGFENSGQSNKDQPDLSDASTSSYYLDQLLKRPASPDCANPWGDPKQKKKNKPVLSGTTGIKKKCKKSKK